MKPTKRPQVALLIESSRAYGRRILSGIARYVREHQPWAISLQERSLGDTCPSWFKDWKGDGVIARVENRQIASVIRRLGVPAVDVRYLLRNLNLPSVRPNDTSAARMAFDHLRQRGFRHFAFCGFNGADYSDIRRDTFADCANTAGFTCHVYSARQDIHRKSTREYEARGLKDGHAVARWLKKLPKPVGLMACNDIRGQQVLNACRAAGIVVPNDIAVVGVDDDEVLCELSDPPLSSVSLDTERIGYEAAALLDQMIAGRKPVSPNIFVEPVGVITRRSTDVLAIDDRQIADLLRLIHERANEGIDVGDLLKNTPLSRSTLERRFLRLLGHTPKEEILRIRIARAKQLLAETDLPLAVIAEKVGFEHAEYFNVIFKKKTRLTPGVFRTHAHTPKPNNSWPKLTMPD